MKLGLGLGLGRGGGNPARRIVRPFFNGIPDATMTFTGGPNATLDNNGVLQKPALDVPAITGGRFVDAATGFVDTYAEGVDLYANTLVRGIKLYTDADPTEFKRYLGEPARTNKCACVKANPTNTTNISKGGDAASVLSVVDDTAALAAAGLSDICTSGKVYKLDNTAGSVVANIKIDGYTENTNIHAASIVARVTAGSAGLRINSSVGAETVVSGSTYTRHQTVVTPSSTIRSLWVDASAGAVVYFILPQLEEGSFCTSPIIGDNSAAAQVRQATRLVCPSAGVLRGNDIAIMGQVIPSAGGQGTDSLPCEIFASHKDVNNWLRIGLSAQTNRIFFTKYLSGFNTAAAAYTHAASTPFRYQAYLSSTYGMGVSVSYWTGSAWSAWTGWATNADTQDAPIAATYEIGSRSGSNHFAGNYQLFRTFFTTDPKTYLEGLR